MARRKVLMKVRELTEMEVETLSLVKRGANRVPFRITKSDGDSEMNFNLDNLFLKKREAVEPALVAVAIADVKHSQLIIDALKKEGIDIDHVNQEEGSTSATLMLGKDDDLPEDVVAYKLGDHAAMLFTGIKKGLMSYPETGDFVENIQTAGFIPSFRIASEVLMDTVRNILYEEGDADVTKSAVKKALGDFKGYVEAVMATVPVNAFKAEKAIDGIEKGMLLGTGINSEGSTSSDPKAKAIAVARDAAIATAKDKDGDKPRDASDYEKLGEKAGTKAGKTFDTAAAATAAAAAAAAEDDDDSDDNAGDDAGDDAGEDTNLDLSAAGADDAGDGDDAGASDDQGTEAVTKAIAALTTTLESMNLSINKKIDEVKGGLDKRLDSMDEMVKKNEEAIEGTVHSGSTEDSDSTQVKKGDADTGQFENILDFGDVELN